MNSCLISPLIIQCLVDAFRDAALCMLTRASQMADKSKSGGRPEKNIVHQNAIMG